MTTHQKHTRPWRKGRQSLDEVRAADQREVNGGQGIGVRQQGQDTRHTQALRNHFLVGNMQR
jgi:hypothetical protein